jgi:hypothetical protein
VMISKIVDTHKSGTVSPGDTIKMGKYPTSPAVITLAGVRKAFEDWKVKTHTVDTVALFQDGVYVRTTTGGWHTWYRNGPSASDHYTESNDGATSNTSNIHDKALVGGTDKAIAKPASPSQPTSSLDLSGPGLGDDGFIDVEIYVATS